MVLGGDDKGNFYKSYQNKWKYLSKLGFVNRNDKQLSHLLSEKKKAS